MQQLRPLSLLLIGALAVQALGSMAGHRSGAKPYTSAKSASAGAVPGAGAVSAASPMSPAANLTAGVQAGPSAPAMGPAPAEGRAQGSRATAPPVEPAAAENSSDWEVNFAWGMYHSKMAVEASETTTQRWSFDREGSLAAVPEQMLRAEGLLKSAALAAVPAGKQREKLAEAALRVYYHAKWLAEQNYVRGAEWRYREASRLAQQAKRSVLAAHAMSRLGYFLMHWRRPDDAREALRLSEELNTKSNPLAPYLYGILERRSAGADEERLRDAEDRILSAGKQPSEDLDVERQDLVNEIRFWRAAEGSPRRCFDATDAAQALICFSCHAFSALLR